MNEAWETPERMGEGVKARHKNQALLFAKSHYAGYPILSALGIGAHTEAQFARGMEDLNVKLGDTESPDTPDGLHIWEGEVLYQDEDVLFWGKCRPALPGDLERFGTEAMTLEFHAKSEPPLSLLESGAG